MQEEKRTILKKYHQMLKRQERHQFQKVLGVTLSAAIFQSLGVGAIFPFMNLVMNPEAALQHPWMVFLFQWTGFSHLNQLIVGAGAVLLIMIVLGNLVSTFALWYQTQFVWSINHRLSATLLESYLSSPYTFFLGHNSAELAKNVLSEVNDMTHHFLLPLMTVITKLLVAAATLLLLLVINPLITLIAVGAIGGCYAVILKSFRSSLLRGGRQGMMFNTERYKAVTEALGGIKELKVLGKERFFLERYVDSSIRFSKLQAWREVIGKIPRHLMEIVSFGGVVLLTTIILITRGNVQQAIPLISLFAFAGYRLMPALQDAYNALATMQFSSAIVDRISRDLEESQRETGRVPEQQEIEKEKALPFRHAIKLEKICFTYPGGQEPVVKEVSLDIRRNTSVAIAGPTGSGKTTLVDIILGLLTPDSGQLKVDDQPITSENLSCWRQHMGYVPQQIYLSDDTVKRNIAFGVPDGKIDEDRVVHAARVANIHDFIVGHMPGGYDTLVGERGIRLSGGQRQRIGIARALYRDPEVMVMDEATSSLDGITEAAVIRAMENVAELKTMIIIAHRLTTIRNCDAIYLMDQGRIVDQGTYEELANRNTQFQQMAKGSDSLKRNGKAV